MCCGQLYSALLLARSDPDRACSANEPEGIVSNNVGWTLESEHNRIARIGADVPKLVGDPEYNASRVGAVSNQSGVIGQKAELLIETFSRVAARNNLLAANVTINAEVGPERREINIGQVGKNGGYFKCLNCSRSGSASTISFPLR